MPGTAGRGGRNLQAMVLPVAPAASALPMARYSCLGAAAPSRQLRLLLLRQLRAAGASTGMCRCRGAYLLPRARTATRAVTRAATQGDGNKRRKWRG
jgi:hypothetical protein